MYCVRTQRTAILRTKCSTKCRYRFAILHTELVVSGSLVFNGFAIRYYKISKLVLRLHSGLPNAYQILKSPLSIRPSVRPSVRPYVRIKLENHSTDLHKICYWKILLKIYRAVSIFVNIRGRYMPISKPCIFRHTCN